MQMGKALVAKIKFGRADSTLGKVEVDNGLECS